jgi:phosphoenolpyruvate carboxylase
VLPRLVEEHDRTVEALRRITGRGPGEHDPDLRRSCGCATPTSTRSTPCRSGSCAGVRTEEDETVASDVRDAVLIATNGIAAGLRNTG